MIQVSLRHALLLSTFVLSLGGCAAPIGKATPTPVAHPPSLASPAALPETSLYQLGGEWEDQNGQAFSLSTLRGRPQVIAMVYGSCKGACPRIISDIQAMENLVQAKSSAGDIGFVLVTMDPEIDSPQRLRGLVDKFDLGPDWRLLRGTTDQVRELAAVLGVKYRKISETDYAHSNTITVLDKEGSIVHQKQELGTGVDESAKALEGLLPAGVDACCQKTP